VLWLALSARAPWLGWLQMAAATVLYFGSRAIGRRGG